jgi:hypothetical protein
MPNFELDVWATRLTSNNFSHIVKGSFADPQFDTRGMTDLFCYDRITGIGVFLATVKNGRLDDGTPVLDGPHQVGREHTFSSRWTHIVDVPTANIPQPPNFPPKLRAGMLLFYDATSGVGEFHTTDGRGNLTLKKRHSGLRTSWNLIVAGRFGTKAHLLFYDAADGIGEFYSVDNSGNLHLERRNTGWVSSWHSIITGNFSNSEFDDLLFYDKSRGVGVFYKVNGTAGRTLLSEHTDWRTTWQHVVSGQFLQNAPFGSLLFYEEGSGHTEFYSTDGHGGISQIDVNLGFEWSLPWQVILAGEFTPDIGLIGTSRFCNYDSKDGRLRYFFLEPLTIKTVIDLNGKWTDGSARRAIITASFTFLTIDMSAFNRPAANGSIVDSSTIKITFSDSNDATLTGKLQPPNTIRWSNGSTWRKV